MNVDNIIELVTKEVLKRLKKEGLMEKRKKILLFNGDEEYKVFLERKLKNYEILTKVEDLEEIEYIMIASIDNKLLYNLSIGKEEDETSKILIQGIFGGKKIFLLKENIFYRKFKETCNENFYRLFEKQEEKIKSYGVVVKSLEEIEAILEKKENLVRESIETEKIQEKASKEIDFTKKKVINQFELKDIREEIDCILVDKKSILTPLAKDYLRERNMSVKRV